MHKAWMGGDRRRWLVALNALAIVAVVAMASFTGCGGGDSSTNNNNNNDSGSSGGGDSTTCTNTQTDPMNCGKCGNACMAGQVCSAGACASMCGANSTQCGQSCVDLKNDNANCGKCGTACTMGQVCSAGACATNCGGGTTLCSMMCVDTKVDPNNCGGCGTTCVAGKSCVAGSCVSVCGSGGTYCPGSEGGAGYCANTATDNANCGGCGTNCGQGQVCSAGQCGADCGQGEKLCTGDGGSFCANTNSDEANCGDCGVVCGGGEVCQGGKCQNACASIDGGVETLCTPEGGAPYCADTNNSNSDCGACGNKCGQGQVCQNGQCANGCASPDGGVETLCTPDGGAPYCADTNDDNNNCGACGVACGNGQACSGGVCTTNCGGGETLCMGDGGAYCANLQTDNANCGACGTVCAGACNAGVCSTLLTFGGVQTNLPIATVTSSGWTQCFTDTYNVAIRYNDVASVCSQAHLLEACYPTGGTILTVAAMGLRTDVLFLTGNTMQGQNKTHTANGVEWYADDGWSIGYAPAGDAVNLFQCDVDTTPDDGSRLCWHTINNAGGYRCGANTALNLSNAWTRVVYQAP